MNQCGCIKVSVCLLCVCRTKLNEAFSQWQSYDELFKDLSQWLKNFEKKLKEEMGPQTDLSSKQKQLDVVKVMTTVSFVAKNYWVAAVLSCFCFNSLILMSLQQYMYCIC